MGFEQISGPNLIIPNLVANSIRPRLYASLTYYVRTDGNDNNNGLTNTAGGAFRTIQMAVNTHATLDVNAQSVTIQLADGTYAENVQLLPYVGRGGQGHTTPVIQGNNSTPSNVLVQPSSGNAFTAVETGGFEWIIKDLKIIATSAIAVLADCGSWVCINNVTFGSTNIPCVAENSGIIEFVGNVNIVSSGNIFLYVTVGGRAIFVPSAVTITLTGTPAFTTFVQADRGGIVSASSVAFSGSATGQRFNVLTGGGIDTNGGGANYFPGNSAGVATSPGWYS